MSNYYVLVDYENIQPDIESYRLVNDERIHIIIFTNIKLRLPVDMVIALKPFGDRVDYVAMSGSGPNALDFLIACYLGRMWHENPETQFFIISGDKGFDPLVEHLNGKRQDSVRRVNNIAEIKGHIVAQPGIMKQRVMNICVALLALPEDNRPESVVTLGKLIQDTVHDSDVPKRHIVGLVSFMKQKKLISTNEAEGFQYHWDRIAAGAEGEFTAKAPAPAAPLQLEEATPLPEPAPPLKVQDLVKEACDNLKKRGNSKPRKLETLTTTIKADFHNNLSDQQIEAILNNMKARQIITVSEGAKITYNLEKPVSQAATHP